MTWKIKGKDGWGDTIEFKFETKKELDSFYEGFYAVSRNDDAYLDEESIEEI